MPSAGSKVSEILEPFGKARSSTIFEIFGAGDTTKNLGDFWSPPEPFSAWFISLWLSARLLGAEHRSGTEIYLEFIEWPYLSTEIRALPGAAAQIAQET